MAGTARRGDAADAALLRRARPHPDAAGRDPVVRTLGLVDAPNTPVPAWIRRPAATPVNPAAGKRPRSRNFGAGEL
jgi:hypothetical protein